MSDQPVHPFIDPNSGAAPQPGGMVAGGVPTTDEDGQTDVGAQFPDTVEGAAGQAAGLSLIEQNERAGEPIETQGIDEEGKATGEVDEGIADAPTVAGDESAGTKQTRGRSKPTADGK